ARGNSMPGAGLERGGVEHMKPAGVCVVGGELVGRGQRRAAIRTERERDGEGGAPCHIGWSCMFFPVCGVKRNAQFIGDCSSSKWSKHVTNSPFLARLATVGSSAAYKIISACSNAVSG